MERRYWRRIGTVRELRLNFSYASGRVGENINILGSTHLHIVNNHLWIAGELPRALTFVFRFLHLSQLIAARLRRSFVVLGVDMVILAAGLESLLHYRILGPMEPNELSGKGTIHGP